MQHAVTMAGPSLTCILVTFLLLPIWDAFNLQEDNQNRGTLDVGLSAENNVKVLRSPLYPLCCQPVEYRLYYEGAGSAAPPGNLINYQIVFDDIDIPPGSQLRVYSGWSNESRPLSPLPHYRKGYWTRPFVSAKAEKIRIEFIPGETGNKNYTGFKAEVSTLSSPRILDVPFTTCPRVIDPMDGGEIKLDTLSMPHDRTHYRFDCVWQLVPTVQGWHVFVHIDSMQLTDGLLWIRNGSHADSSILQQYTPSSPDIQVTSSPRVTFTSDEGLYIRLQKPMDQGHVHFTYGMYQELDTEDPLTTDALTINNKTCSLRVNADAELPGYHCQGSQWCVLNVYVCNGIADCPRKEEENNCTERPATTTITPATPVTVCPKRCFNGDCVAENAVCEFDPSEEQCDKKKGSYKWCKKAELCIGYSNECPGECGFMEKECDDGTCVRKYLEACEGECKYGERQCYDGTCIDYMYRDKCPDSTCPSHKPNSCGTNKYCYYNHDRCDGGSDCPSGYEDEKNCPTYNGGGNSNNSNFRGGQVVGYMIALGVVSVCLVMCACCCSNEKKKARQREQRQRELETNFPLHYSEPARPPPTARQPTTHMTGGHYDTAAPSYSDVEASAPLTEYQPYPPPPFPGPPDPSAPSIPLTDLPPSYDEAVNMTNNGDDEDA